MAGIAERANSFIERLNWLRPYMGGYIPALLLILKIKLTGDGQGRGTYKGQPFTFKARDMSAIREVLADNEYEFLAPALEKLERPIILDCGGHIGLFSLWARSKNPACDIVSLEASPGTFATLQSNAANDTGLPGQWKVIHGAAWKDETPVSFATSGDSMGHQVSTQGGESIPGVTLERMMATARDEFGADHIDLLKVDIEGAEEAFLTAGEDFLPFVSRIAIELHPKSCDTEKVRAILAAHYDTIEPCQNRLSQKPLLHCYNKGI